MLKILFIIVVIIYLIFSFSDKQPKKPKYDFAQSDIRDAIEASDNYKDNKTAFLFKTKELVDSGRCTLKEIKEQGGWMYAPIRTKEVGGLQYFIHCGGTNNSNKIYLDISSYRYK